MENLYEELLQKAASFLEVKDYMNAEIPLEQVFHNFDKSVPIAELLMVVYHNNHHYVEALQAVNFIERNSGDEHRPDLLLNRAVLYHWLGDLETAQNCAESMIATYAPQLSKSDLDDVFKQYAHTLLETNQLNTAKGLIERFLLEDEAHPYNQYLLAKYHYQQGYYTRAIQLAEPQLGSERYDHMIRLLLIESHYALGNQQACDRMIKDSRKLYRDHLYFRSWGGLRLLVKGATKPAEKILESVQSEFNDFYLALQLLAQVYAQTNRPRLAKMYLDTAFEKAPWNDEVIGVRARFLAKYHPDMLDIEELETLAQNEKYPKLAYHVAKIYAETLQNPTKALEWSLLAEQKLPEHVATKHLLIQLYGRLNQDDQIIQKKGEIHSLNPSYKFD